MSAIAAGAKVNNNIIYLVEFMREIKFRVWHKEKLKMLEGSLEFWMRASAETGKGFLGENIELMQYTGLNDKNGKPIYEGDIAALNGKNYVIEWSQEYCCYISVQVDDREEWFEHLADIDFEFEVIGNIYENSDLLKTKEKDK